MMARLVQSQLVTALTSFFQKDVGLAEKVTEKDDQVDNLLSLIEDTCFRRITEGVDPEGVRARQFRGAFRVALNLEKLGDYAVNVAEPAVHLSRLSPGPTPFDLASSARVALAALDLVIESFTDADAEKAKEACRCEADLDRRYRGALQEAFRRLGESRHEPAFIITNLFVAKFLERAVTVVSLVHGRRSKPCRQASCGISSASRTSISTRSTGRAPWTCAGG